MGNDRTDAVMTRLVRGIDLANAVAPTDYDGLVFVVVVAEARTGELSWACSDSVVAGLHIMMGIVEGEIGGPIGETMQ